MIDRGLSPSTRTHRQEGADPAYPLVFRGTLGRMEEMNRSEMRMATKRLAEKARKAQGQPTAGDIDNAHALFEKRQDYLVDRLSSSVKLRYCEEPDWSTWAAIADFFCAYHAALVETDNKLAIPLAKIRLQGI